MPPPQSSCRYVTSLTAHSLSITHGTKCNSERTAQQGGGLSNHIKVKARIHSLLYSPVMIAIQDLQVIYGSFIKPQGLLAKKVLKHIFSRVVCIGTSIV